MRWLRRTPTVPAAVRAVLPLEPGERVLAAAAVADPSYAPAATLAGVPPPFAVATDRALLVPDGDAYARLPWWRVDAATWDDESDRLVLDVGTERGRRSRRVALPDPQRLPETVRERVQSTILVSRHVPLAGRAGVRLVARRVPGGDEPLWQTIYDAGLDPADPEVRAAAEAALAALRAQTTA